jgi:hypothetical protein
MLSRYVLHVNRLPAKTGCACTDLLVPLAAKMSEEPFRLIIMDSITANLRVDFTGRGTLATLISSVPFSLGMNEHTLWVTEGTQKRVIL